jgi:calcineurin-like phosphoesterase
MRILVLGDVVGRSGREAIWEILPSLNKSEKIDLAVANAENVSGGAGVDIKSA